MKSKILVVALIGVLMMTGLVLSCKKDAACCTTDDFIKWMSNESITDEASAKAAGMPQCCIDSAFDVDLDCCKAAFDGLPNAPPDGPDAPDGPEGPDGHE